MPDITSIKVGIPSCAKTRPDLRMCFQQSQLPAQFGATMYDTVPTLDPTLRGHGC